MTDPPVIYSNFDHQLEPGAEALLQSGEKGSHSAWEFWGTLWYADGCYFEEIECYHQVMETLQSDTLMGVIQQANERWGRK